MSQEVFIEGDNPNSTQVEDVVVIEKGDFRSDDEDNISEKADFTNFVDGATFMACQENGGKIFSASPRKD